MPDFSFKVRLSDVSASRLNTSNRPRDAMPFYRLHFDGKVIQSDVCRAAGDPAWEHKCTFEYRLVEESLEACIESLQQRTATMSILFQDLDTGREIPVGSATVDLFTLASGAAKCVYDLHNNTDGQPSSTTSRGGGAAPVGAVEFTLQVEQQTVVAIEFQSVEVHSMREAAPFKLAYTLQSMDGSHEIESVVVSATKEPAWSAAMLPRLMVRTTLRNLLSDKLQFTIKDATATGNRNPNGDASGAYFECLLEEVVQVHQNHTASFQRNAYAMGGAAGKSSWGALVSSTVVFRDMPALAQLATGSNVNGQVHGKPLLKSCITPMGYSKWPARLAPRGGGMDANNGGIPISANMYMGNTDTEGFGRLAPAQRKLQEAVEVGRLMHSSPPQERMQYGIGPYQDRFGAGGTAHQEVHHHHHHVDAMSGHAIGVPGGSPQNIGSAISLEDAQMANQAIADRRRRLIDNQQHEYLRNGAADRAGVVNETRMGQRLPSPHRQLRFEQHQQDIHNSSNYNVQSSGSPNRRLSYEQQRQPSPSRMPLLHRPQPPPSYNNNNNTSGGMHVDPLAGRQALPQQMPAYEPRTVSPQKHRSMERSREVIDTSNSFMAASQNNSGLPPPPIAVYTHAPTPITSQQSSRVEYLSRSPIRSGTGGSDLQQSHLSSVHHGTGNILRHRSPFATTGDSIVQQYEQAVRDIEAQLARVASLRQQLDDDGVQNDIKTQEFNMNAMREEETLQRDIEKKDRQLEEIRHHHQCYDRGVEEELKRANIEQQSLLNEMDELSGVENHLCEMQLRIREQLRRDEEAKERARIEALNATARLRGTAEEFYSLEQKLSRSHRGGGAPPPSAPLRYAAAAAERDPRTSPSRGGRISPNNRRSASAVSTLPPNSPSRYHSPEMETRHISPDRGMASLPGSVATAPPLPPPPISSSLSSRGGGYLPHPSPSSSVLMDLPPDMSNVPSPVRATMHNLSPLQQHQQQHPQGDRDFRSRSPVRGGGSTAASAMRVSSPQRVLYPRGEDDSVVAKARPPPPPPAHSSSSTSQMNHPESLALSETEKLDVRDLQDAIMSGDAKRFRQLVSSAPEAIFNSESHMIDACSAADPSYEIIAALVSMRPELVNLPQATTGNTPLHLICATRASSPCKALDCLIDAGADISAQNQDGLTPFHVALMNTSDDKSGGSSSASMRMFLVRRCGKKVLDATTAKGESPAHICVIHDRFLGALKFLHTEGANLSATAMVLRGSGAGELQTPLSKARMFGPSSSAIREFLQQNGAQ